VGCRVLPLGHLPSRGTPQLGDWNGTCYGELLEDGNDSDHAWGEEVRRRTRVRWTATMTYATPTKGGGVRSDGRYAETQTKEPLPWLLKRLVGAGADGSSRGARADETYYCAGGTSGWSWSLARTTHRENETSHGVVDDGRLPRERCGQGCNVDGEVHGRRTASANQS
jgi:hypothetical protein